MEAALSAVTASTLQGSTVHMKPVLWDDIGGLEGVKAEIRQVAEWPLLYADTFARLGAVPAKGILLYVTTSSPPHTRARVHTPAQFVTTRLA